MHGGISLTSMGELIVAGQDFEVVLKLTVGELREMAGMLEDVAFRLDGAATDLAPAALARAAGRLQ